MALTFEIKNWPKVTAHPLPTNNLLITSKLHRGPRWPWPLTKKLNLKFKVIAHYLHNCNLLIKYEPVWAKRRIKRECTCRQWYCTDVCYGLDCWTLTGSFIQGRSTSFTIGTCGLSKSLIRRVGVKICSGQVMLHGRTYELINIGRSQSKALVKI